MRTETKLGLVATYLLLSACGTGDEIPTGGQGGGGSGAGAGGTPSGGARATGGQIFAIMPLGGAVSTGGVRNTGGQIYAIMPIAVMPMPVMPVGSGGAASLASEARPAAGADPATEDDWWRAAEAALRST
jgi:hypothetical protein